MKQDIYCLISSISERDLIFPTLYDIKMKLRSEKIAHSIPGLNWHLTHVTPFLATAAEIKWLALGLEIGKALSPSHHTVRELQSTEFDFYESKEEDALILRLEASEAFRDTISRARAHVQSMTDMKHKPESFQVNFHITVAKGKGLRQSIEKHPEVLEMLEKIKKQTVTHFEYPHIVLRGKEYWEPVSMY